MSSFTTPLSISPAGSQWRTDRALEAWIGSEELRLWITVEAGFLTDLGSIPRLLWWLFPPHDPRFAAVFVLHDKLCSVLGFDRRTADAIFCDLGLVLAEEHRVSPWRVYAMYYGIRFYVTWMKR